MRKERLRVEMLNNWEAAGYDWNKKEVVMGSKIVKVQ